MIVLALLRVRTWFGTRSRICALISSVLASVGDKIPVCESFWFGGQNIWMDKIDEVF